MWSERLIWIGLIALLLVGGWLLSRSFPPQNRATAEVTTFRAWFWEGRTLDLLAQVGLIFAGALGVAALLPSRAELRSGDENRHGPLA